MEYERFIAMDMVDGAVPVLGQTWTERPSVTSARARHLFLAGDTIGVPGQGGDIAFNAALTCAGIVKEFLSKPSV